jgi:tetratricopeptide (TPR) repeat protein
VFCFSRHGSGLLRVEEIMTAESPAKPLSSEELEQVRQTVEMFEVITQANPQDTQSLEILKEAYYRMGQKDQSLAIARRLADSYLELGQYSSALLEYEGILQKQPDNAEIIAALGEVEQRLQSAQKEAQGSSVINLDFSKVVVEGGNIMATKKTAGERPLSLAGANSANVAARLEGVSDGNDALMRFLLQHRLAPEDVVTQALSITRKKNKERKGAQLASSLIDEIVTRGSVDLEQLLCGILDRSKFAYIPLEHYEIDRQIVRMLPENLTLGRLIVPFDIISRTMMVALANPFDAEGKQAVQQLLDYNVQWHLASPAAIVKVLNDVHRL